jgi:DoxX-like protein
MYIAYVVLAVLLALACTMSASGKLRRDERNIEIIHRQVGVPLRWFPWLAACELAGAAGVLVGIAWAPIGLAAASGLTLYFLLALLAHVRIGDWKGTTLPLVPLALSIATLVARALSL